MWDCTFHICKGITKINSNRICFYFLSRAGVYLLKVFPDSPTAWVYLKTIKRNFQETSPVDAATFWISAETLKNRRRQSESKLHKTLL